MKLTLVITTYNRTDMVLEVFEKVKDHPLIDEIVIVDDASDWDKWDSLKGLLFERVGMLGRLSLDKNDYIFGDKVKLFRNEENLGMSRNKREAVSKAKNEWVILFDSDNILYPEYLDAVAKENLNPLIIYCPEKAEPDHDFTTLPNRVIDKQNAKDFLRQVEFRVFLNTCNYVVNRDEYLRVYKYDESIKESDTIYFNTMWLEAGNAFYVVPGMKYHHRKHSGSGWLTGDHSYNLKKAAELQEKIKNL